jgi:hypothetical protein
MKSLRVLGIVMILSCLLVTGSARAEVESFHDSGLIPVDVILWNECTGEDVHLSGSLRWINHGVVTNSGVLQWRFHNKYQGVTGIGLVSGIKYQAIGGDEQGYGTAVADPDRPYHYAAGGMYTIHLVSQGNAADLLIKARGRLTVTPDYRWLAHIESYQLICR